MTQSVSNISSYAHLYPTVSEGSVPSLAKQRILTVGYVQYNGFRFSPYSTVKVSQEPVSDSTGRYVKFSRYVITVETVINYEDIIPIGGGSSDSVDEAIQYLRHTLEEQGKNFVMIDRGFGELVVLGTMDSADTLLDTEDTASTTSPEDYYTDVNKGPKTKTIIWEAIGANLTWRCVWTCEVCVSECQEPNPNGQAGLKPLLLEASYEQAFNINDEGLTVRVTKTYIECVPTIVNGKTHLGADEWRDYYKPILPLGFRRTTSHNISSDKRILTQSFVDVEIPSDNPYPNFVSKIDVQYDVAADNMAMVTWTSRLVGNITLAPGVPHILAWQVLINILKDRYDRARGIAMKVTDPLSSVGRSYNVTNTLRLTQVSIGEDLYDRVVRFSFEWKFAADTDKLMQATGLFQPLNKTVRYNWNEWRTSVGPTVHHNRGYAGLRVDTNDEIIRTPCDENINEQIINGERHPFAAGAYNYLFRKEKRTKENSYEFRKCAFRLHRKNNLALLNHQYSVPASDVTPGIAPTDVYSTFTGSTTQTEDNPYLSNSSAVQSSQVRGPAEYTLVFSFVAERIGYDVDKPVLQSVEGVTKISMIDEKYQVQVLSIDNLGQRHTRYYYQGIYSLSNAPTGTLQASVKHSGTTLLTVVQ